MRFSPRLPQDTATLLFLSGFIIVLVGISAETHDRASDDIVTISAIAAVRGADRLRRLGLRLPAERAGRAAAASAEPARRAAADVDRACSRSAAIGAAFVSEWFIDALRPTIDQLGISAQFAGLVIVAIAGNAVEHAVGVVLAAKGQADLAISVVKNSVAQVAAFLAPALVLVSLAVRRPAHVRPRAGLRRRARAHDPVDLAGHRRRRGDVLRGRGADRDVRDPGSVHALRMTDFAATLTAAYATEGAAIDLGRGVHDGALLRDGRGEDPARDDEPARARRRRDRHRQDEDAAGASPSSSRAPACRCSSPTSRATCPGSRRRRAGGAGEKRMADLGLPFAPEAFPVEFLVARRARARACRSARP